MAFDSVAIANEVLDVAERRGIDVSPLKLQKLIYYANGWSLALFNKPLIDEQVEAWNYGPVIPSVYHAFKHCGNNPIRERVPTQFRVESGYDGGIARALIDRVVSTYGKATAMQLSAATHASDTPWASVNNRYGGAIPKGTDIPADSIRAFFKKNSKRDAQANAG